jgi:hypothetical protein
VYLRVVGCLLAALVLVGAVACGGGSEEPKKSSTAGGYSTYTVESEHFSISLPETLRVMKKSTYLQAGHFTCPSRPDNSERGSFPSTST